ncbi:E3 ubiquitin-protein ligase AIRP2-like isoform X4 [Actinidia eriantha]|uniref:E3 ubiquitin-protein ligase AIRP2-like isoform X4 n=1 Tax=Actinidia eriantha TaxID=165200 RepID=UPI00258A3DD2|nr:E3 ubiquitin-protein ligase AIRP2-like isoform X4 [Actinidia eriantha]
MRKSFKDSLKALEADIHHANTLAEGINSMGACRPTRMARLPCLYMKGKLALESFMRGITDVEDRKQREMCAAKYKRRDEMDKGKLSEIDTEREEECGICLEMNSKVVLPKCSHSMCMTCYRNWTYIFGIMIIYMLSISITRKWRARSQSCPFCRDSLKRVNSGDLWIYTSSCDVADLSSIAKENLKRLVMYIEKLPLVEPDPMLVSYDPHFR